MTDRAEIAAFRFGFGLPLDGPAGPDDLLAQLTGPDQAAQRWPAYGVAEVIPVMQVLREARRMAAEAPGDKAAKKAQRRAVKAGGALAVTGAKAALARAVGGPAFRERMVRFWADHFTVVPRSRTERAWPAALVEDAIRPHVAGRFGDMLQAVMTHPAMLIYLDQAQSLGPNSRRGAKRGKGLNENLARELLELHTLGVGAGYRQEDVRQLAELLTGLTVVPDRGFAFDPGRVEPGPETVLGVEYGGDGLEAVLAALQDLALRPETARHVAGKLAVHFVSDGPDPALVAAIEAAWTASGGDLAAVAAELVGHDAAWGPEAAKARQPFDFVAAALRALGLSGDDIMAMAEGPFLRLILDPMAEMGQPWQGAGGPDGWPEAAGDWITPQGMAARITWAMEVPGRLVTPLPEAAEVAARALGRRLSGRLEWAVGAAESRREALGLVLAAPEFNRR
ncbi:MAG: DUF1800 domain-containing protein [Rhodobacter sp.]|nr:DUF1800 domain-containing protein [Rhodobacter sp.]